MGRVKVYHKEADVLHDCIDLLIDLKIWGMLTFRRIQVGGVKGSKGGKRKNPMAGMSDIIIFLNTAPPIVLQPEIKAPKKKQEPSQVAWQKELDQFGHGKLYKLIYGRPGLQEWLLTYLPAVQLSKFHKDALREKLTATP